MNTLTTANSICLRESMQPPLYVRASEREDKVDHLLQLNARLSEKAVRYDTALAVRN
jgi:hypothetical protein